MDEQQAFEDREWYTSTSTGQRGYMVERDGVKYIRLDRGRHSPEEAWHPTRWTLETEPDRQCNMIQLARVLHDADASLCRQLGHTGVARKDWLSLSDKERQAWWSKPPPGRKIRARLWAYSKKGLEVILRG